MIEINKPLIYISERLRLEQPWGKPIIRTIEPTNACMMNCIMCPRKNMKRKIEFMNLEFFKSIIDQAKWNKGMDFSQFGDPLCHPELDKMIEYCENKNIRTMIGINPNLLTENNVIKLLKAGISSMGISIDGLNDKQYKFYRGKNADYELAKKNIKNLLKIKNQMRSDVEIHIGVILNNDLKDNFDKFKKIWNEVGVKNIQPMGYKAFDGSVDEIFKYGKVYKKFKYQCSEPWVGVSVVASGKVVPCCYDYDEKCVLGDLKKQTLLEVWNGEPMRKLRKEFIEKNVKNRLCVNCVNRQEIDLKGILISKIRKKIWEMRK